MDEATLAGIEQRANRMEVLLADSHPDSEPCTLLCEAAADVYDDQRALRREVRRLSAALAEQQRETECARTALNEAFVEAEAEHADATARAHAAEAALADHRAKVEAVEALHERAEGPDGESLCSECGDGTGSEDWPCPTLNALDHPSWCGRDLGHRGPCTAAALAAAPSGEPNTEEGTK